MPFTSWLPFASAGKQSFGTDKDDNDTSKQEKVSDTIQPLEVSFEDIATRFANLTEEVAKLQIQLSDQEARMKQQSQTHVATLDQLRTAYQKEIATTAALQRAIGGPNPKHLDNLRRKGDIEPFTQLLSSQRKERKENGSQQFKRLKQAEKSNQELQKQVVDLLAENYELKKLSEELQLDNEYLKCTTAQLDSETLRSIVNQNAPLPEVPFVLVLIDGDAYSFVTSEAGVSDVELKVHPATRVVRRMKTCLYNYIQQNSLPPHCKFIVRVLQNAHGARGHRKLGTVVRHGKTISPSEDFMLAFNETSPLFDYVDAGSGKERVDGKIHELYATFIPNSSCYKIFVAVAPDNGFARMLEQYVDHPVARAKTCLISSGFVAEEIRCLDLETVEWPNVFLMRHPPKEQQEVKARRAKRDRQLEEKREKEKEELIKLLGVHGYEKQLVDQAIAKTTKGLMGGKDVRSLVEDLRAWDRRAVGVRTAASYSGFTPATTDNDFSIVQFEEGVD